ncbi:MAG: hypothetical protein H6810_02900 [Phycisphaeraceae bacterium]|nr:MAG: hypothetical protein H6810_02900 [Phycisphaeraceae bacterium]
MHTPTEKDGQLALRDHIVARALGARDRHGPVIDAESIMRLLDDRAAVRYPVGVRFDAGPLEPGEFAWAMPLGERPSDGFCLFIHPHFERRPEAWPLLIAYHLPSVNYGEIVTADEAELFAVTLLGMDIDVYYHALCALADEIAGAGAQPHTHH